MPRMNKMWIWIFPTSFFFLFLRICSAFIEKKISFIYTILYFCENCAKKSQNSSLFFQFFTSFHEISVFQYFTLDFFFSIKTLKVHGYYYPLDYHKLLVNTWVLWKLKTTCKLTRCTFLMQCMLFLEKYSFPLFLMNLICFKYIFQ